MLKKLRYCSKCVMPETVEGNKFDKDGKCIVCQAQDSKKKVDWDQRKIQIKEMLQRILTRTNHGLISYFL